MTQPVFSGLRALPALLVLLLLASLAGCGQPPGDKLVLQALNQELQRAHLGQLLEVSHIDSMQSHQQDSDNYFMKVAYTLRAKQDLDAYTKQVKADPARTTEDRFAMLMTLAAVRQQFGDFHEGDTFKQQRRILLRHDTHGWSIPHPAKAAPPRS